MNKSILLVICFIFLAGCASHSSYDTGKFRSREFSIEKIVPNKDGLSEEQIKYITSTKPPSKFPIDVSILIMNTYVDPKIENLLMSNAISGLKSSDKISRITPIPKFLNPNPVNFSSIQELGVRTLSEYIIVLNLQSSDYFKSTRITSSEYEILSNIEFILVDSKTAAIVLADKLKSSKIYTGSVFQVGEYEKAQEEIFSEQGKLLGLKISELFNNVTK